MRSYTVKAGDTLGKIARKLEVPLDAIIRLNRITNPDRIRVGQVMEVPDITTDEMDTVEVPVESVPQPPAAQGDLKIDRSRFRLPTKEYYPVVTEKDLIVLHFTAGKNAKSAYDHWVAKPVHVATAYLVDPNGAIYETFDPAHWAYHLGIKGTNGRIDKRSIGIEIANVGPLRPSPSKPDQLSWWPNDWQARYCTRDQRDKYVEATYRGVDYFAVMPDVQQDAVGNLVRHLCERFRIKRTIPAKSRRMELDMGYFGDYKGIASHQNFRKEKWDVGPAFDWGRLGL